MNAHTRCPICQERIELATRQDEESFAKAEYVAHVRERHPDEIRPDRPGIPYAPVLFEGDEGR